MEPTLLLAVGTLASGFVVGILSALFGIGGGTIMVPLVHLAFGEPAAAATGTSLFAIVPTSIASMVNRFRDGTINFSLGATIGLAGAVFSPLGATAATFLPGQVAMLVLSVIIMYSAYNMFSKAYYSRPGAPAKRKSDKPAPLAGARGACLYGSLVALGGMTGFISGFVGLGGGFIVVPLLQMVFGLSMKESTGTSLVAVAILAVPSVIAHALYGNIRWMIGLLLIAGSFFGSRIGAKINRGASEYVLRFAFGGVLVLSGVVLAVTEILG